MSADATPDPTPNPLVQKDPAGRGTKRVQRDSVDRHAHFRSEPDAPDPARRQPGGTLAEFNELGEESAIPRKVRTDTIITTASYPSRRPT
jgi:hypothetical protein